MALTNKLDRPQYAYISPEKSQTRRNTWDEFKKYLGFWPNVSFHEADLRIELPIVGEKKAIIYLGGADNPHSFKGMYLDGVVFDEVAQMPRSIWSDTIRPALSDRKGWGLFIGTPMGKNFFKDLYEYGLSGKSKEWSSFMFKVSETKLIADKELESILLETGDQLYNQNYECSFEAELEGSYYGPLLSHLKTEGRIGDVKYNPNLPVITSWDMGLDKTCVWFAQQVDGKVNVIDYYEDSKQLLTHFINVVLSKPYTYAYHIVPHDVEQGNQVVAVTRHDQMIQAGMKTVIASKLGVDEGISLVRSLLMLCSFNAKNCEKGLEALTHYRSKYDDKNEIQKRIPIHDWASHGADSFRYLAVGIRGEPNRNNPYINKSRFARDEASTAKYDTSYDEFDV